MNIKLIWVDHLPNDCEQCQYSHESEYRAQVEGRHTKLAGYIGCKMVSLVDKIPESKKMLEGTSSFFYSS